MLANSARAVLTSPISVQFVPSYDSTLVTGEPPSGYPVINKAAVWSPPKAELYRDVPKSLTSVQVEPLYSDVLFPAGL